MTILDSDIKFTRALFGGAASAIVIALGSYAVGRLGNFEALRGIEEMRPSLRFTCSAVLTATTTILTLILTLLSFTSRSDYNFKSIHYRRVEQIAKLSTIAFIGSIFLLLLLNIPLDTSQEKISQWYSWIYYMLLGYGALLGGLMITIVLMLYQAATAIIILYHPDKDASFLLSSEEEEEVEETKKEEEKKKEENDTK